MPTMGRPEGLESNSFQNIKMAPRQSESAGEQLNKLAGIKEGMKFVDKNKHNKLDKNAFLKLLTHQLSNQDPLDPMDQKKFAADLAQFSQLEQLANINSKLEGANDGKMDQLKFHGASFLGKEVVTQGTSLFLDEDGQNIDIPFSLPHDAKEVMLRVFDNKNNMIAEIKKQNLSQGSHSLHWDGLSLDNTPAIKGEYRVDVTAWDQQMIKFNGQTSAKGLVTGVDFKNNQTVLILDDGKKSVFLRDVESFKLSKHNEEKAQTVTPKTGAKAYENVKEQM